MKRKVKKEELSFESTCHDIYNPVYSSEEESRDMHGKTFSAMYKTDNRNFSTLLDSKVETSTDNKKLVIFI